MQLASEEVATRLLWDCISDANLSFAQYITLLDNAVRAGCLTGCGLETDAELHLICMRSCQSMSRPSFPVPVCRSSIPSCSPSALPS